MVVFDVLGDLLREADFLIQMADLDHSSDDDLEGADFRLLNFTKVVHDPDDVKLLESVGDRVLLAGDDFLVMDAVESDEGAVDKAFTIGDSQSKV